MTRQTGSGYRRSVLVGDAGSPIGSAVALAFAQTGDRVIACAARNALDDLRDAASDAGLTIDCQAVDRADPAGLARRVGHVAARRRRLDVLVCCSPNDVAGNRRSHADDLLTGFGQSIFGAMMITAALPVMEAGGGGRLLIVEEAQAAEEPWALRGRSIGAAASSNLLTTLAMAGKESRIHLSVVEHGKAEAAMRLSPPDAPSAGDGPARPFIHETLRRLTGLASCPQALAGMLVALSRAKNPYSRYRATELANELIALVPGKS